MATAEPEETAAPPQSPVGRVRWRRVLLYLLGGAVAVTAAEHVLGGRTTAGVAAAGVGIIVLGLVIWRLPHLRKHFHNPNKRPSGSLNYPGQRGRGLMRPLRAGSSASPQRRRAGAGLISGRPRRPTRPGGAGSGRRGAGMLRSRRHAGTTSRARRGRSPVSGRGGAGSALAGRRAARRPGAGRSRSGRAGSRAFPRGGARRRAGTGQGRRGALGRAGSRPFSRAGARRRALAHPPGRSRRRTAFHPLGGRRTAPRTAPPNRARRRTAFHPLGGRRTAPRTAPRGRARRRTPFHPLGGRRTTTPPGRSRPRSWRHPLGGRRTATPPGRSRPRSWRHPLGGPRTTPRGAIWPGWRHIRWRARNRWHRAFGTPGSPRLARRSWHRIFGTPAQRASRRAARRAHRARIRAVRHRRALNLYARRGHGWAFWRWWTRRAPRTHAATGRTMTRRERLARRIRIWRGRHAGLGIRGTGTRSRRAPRPLLGGSILGSPGLSRFRASALGRRIARLDRRRQDRWMRR
ncbi:MAG TPA: hypothetical protein VNH17_06530, partial [Streptosporangiaceae bacterium]|nr:hypothetical protein [Streptosporangiaceae bacterium]